MLDRNAARDSWVIVTIPTIYEGTAANIDQTNALPISMVDTYFYND
jgi:hypothetical protein